MDYKVLRERMIKEQLVARAIKNKEVLNAFYKVERHKFIPEEFRGSAYADYPVPIGEGQTISQPFMVALMTECLLPSPQDRILEIGTGSGYQAAILAELVKEVYSIERFAELARTAEDTLRQLGYKNIKIRVGDGTLGWLEEAPFDKIIVTAASPEIPKPLLERLKEFGRLVIPLGDSFSQVLTVVEKQKDKLIKTEVCGCVFVPLVGKYGWRQN
ncbi:MAG: protein-L-isoaspartate(D-aspartate) O-methyltransferase [Candidatus Omnitrophica bacterium]|nr:protein-L-isoaspartate(D-aspartate) O-methyltransferase [Candidatus Omnitrophota bacterium]